MIPMRSARVRCSALILIIANFLMLISCGKSGSNETTPAKSTAKSIVSFKFNGLSPVITGVISGTVITLNVPSGTNVTALVPTITMSDKASISPGSGSVQDFTNSVIYKVTAEDGSTQTYTVSVVKGKSSAKAITGFVFNGLSPAVNATINETAKTITATVPAGTAVTALVPTITTSDKATMAPASGAAQNFSKEVTYTVTAEDGSKQEYKVTVTIAPAVTKVIDCSSVPDVFEDLGIDVDYIVKCNIAIGGSKEITIKPGVTIQFDGVDAGFTVTGTAALKMVGTAAKPIVLEGKTATAGSWTGIQLSSTNIDNDWEYVTIQHAGGGKYKAGLLIADDQYYSATGGTQMTIKNCKFANNAGYGIWDYDNNYAYGRIVFSAFAANTFTNNSLSALRITIDALGKLDNKSTYVNNGQKYIEINGLGGLYKNITVAKLDAPFLIDDFIRLNQKMTISAGVEMQFFTDAGFILGSGTLIANGTSASPIKFTGYKSGKGVWIGLVLDNNDPEITLNYCMIDGAGSNKPLTGAGCYGDVKAAINLAPDCTSYASHATISNCTITNSGGYGILYRKGTTNTFKSNTYAGNTLDNEATVTS